MHELVGAAFWSKLIAEDWDTLERFLRTEEGRDDYRSLHLTIEDALSSLILSATIKKESLIMQSAFFEDSMLQKYSFRHYMESFGNMKYKIDPEVLLREGMLDIGKYDLLCNYDICCMIRAEVYSKNLASINGFYFFRKCLAKCEFDKWQSVLSEAKKARDIWFDCEQAFKQNQSLLHNLKKTADATSSDETLRTKLLEEIDRQYLRELRAQLNKREDDKAEFLRINSILRHHSLEMCTAKGRARRIQYLPKDHQPTSKLSLQSVHLSNSRIQQLASLFRGRTGGNYLSGLQLLVGGGTAAAAAAATALSFPKTTSSKEVYE